MNKFWGGPRGIGGRTFPLCIEGKALIRGLQKDGMKNIENGGFKFYSWSFEGLCGSCKR